MNRFLFCLALLVTSHLIGCGTVSNTNYPSALTAPDGNPILFDDVSRIITDEDLSEDEKRDALRELGIEDERLIDALLEA